MSHPMRVPPPVGRDGDSGADTSTPSVARAEAGAVGRSAADAGRGVAGTAAEQAGQVTEEARRQAEDLLGQARAQLTEQARGGQQKAGETLRAFASELQRMADGADGSGPASQLAKEAAHRVDGIATWLGRHEPGEVLDEVRGLARRRPGAFLAGATLAGVVVGRLTRGTVDAVRGDSRGHDGPAARDVTERDVAERDVAERDVAERDVAERGRGNGAASTPSGPDLRARLRPDGPEPDPGPSHALRPGATTVGEYVEELERRGELDHPPIAGTS
jgi:hypothetical protein